MILIEKTEVVGWEPTIRGMRNPMNSWTKSDSGFCKGGADGIGCENCAANNFRWGKQMCGHEYDYSFQLGTADFDLMLRLAKAGSVDGKFRRMIAVYVDLTAPLYWWKEFDTYKVGTVANSCSTMHKIHAKEFTLEDFSHEHLLDNPHDPLNLRGVDLTTPLFFMQTIVTALNTYRQKFLETGSEIKQCHFNELEKREELVKLQKQYWWQMIQLLPSSYNQKRTVMLNYEVLANIYQHRRNHKLDEWRELCRWIEELPYSEIITCSAENQARDTPFYASEEKFMEDPTVIELNPTEINFSRWNK